MRRVRRGRRSGIGSSGHQISPFSSLAAKALSSAEIGADALLHRIASPCAAMNLLAPQGPGEFISRGRHGSIPIAQGGRRKSRRIRLAYVDFFRRCLPSKKSARLANGRIFAVSRSQADLAWLMLAQVGLCWLLLAHVDFACLRRRRLDLQMGGIFAGG